MPNDAANLDFTQRIKASKRFMEAFPVRPRLNAPSGQVRNRD